MTAGDPRFSIVVPTRDRPWQLRACLEAIARISVAICAAKSSRVWLFMRAPGW